MVLEYPIKFLTKINTLEASKVDYTQDIKQDMTVILKIEVVSAYGQLFKPIICGNSQLG